MHQVDILIIIPTYFHLKIKINLIKVFYSLIFNFSHQIYYYIYHFTHNYLKNYIHFSYFKKITLLFMVFFF